MSPTRTFALSAAILTLSVALASSTASAAPPPVVDVNPTPTSIRAFNLPDIERLGRELYRQDRAAWLATDALRSRIPDLGKAGVVGWIVAPADRSEDLVRFLRGNPAAPEIGFDVRVPARGAPVVSEPTERALSADEAASWTARRTAIAHVGPVCRPGYNTAVTRDPNGQDWLVWLLAPSPATGVIPVGGHYRFTVSADGATVKSRDKLFATCLTVDPRHSVPAGAKPTAAIASHVVSPTPVETHVFLQLEAGLPLFVVTPMSNKLWSISGGKIREEHR